MGPAASVSPKRRLWPLEAQPALQQRVLRRSTESVSTCGSVLATSADAPTSCKGCRCRRTVGDAPIDRKACRCEGGGAPCASRLTVQLVCSAWWLPGPVECAAAWRPLGRPHSSAVGAQPLQLARSRSPSVASALRSGGAWRMRLAVRVAWARSSSIEFIRDDYSPWTALDVVRVSTRAMILIRYL